MNYEAITPAGIVLSDGPRAARTRGCSRPTRSCSAPGRSRTAALVAPLAARGVAAHVIGGADVAAELDAKRAIDQGSRLAARLEVGTSPACSGLGPDEVIE